MTTAEIDSLNENLLKSIQSDPRDAYQKAFDSYRSSAAILYQKGRIEAAKILAFSSHTLGLIEESFNYLQECIPYFYEQQDFATLAHLYNTESFIYQQLLAPDQRLESSKKSSRFAQESGNQELLIRSLNNLGDAYLAKNYVPDAIDTFNRIQNELEKEDNFMRAVVQCNLAEAHLINGDFRSAHISIEHTLELIEAYGIQSLREATLIILGGIYLAENKFDELLKLIEQWEDSSIKFSDKGNLSDTVRLSLNLQIELNELKISAFEGLNNFESAFLLKKHNESLLDRKNKDAANHTIALFNLRNEMNQLKTDSAQLTELIDKRTIDLKQALNELRIKEAKSKTILNHSSNAIILLNAENEIVEINERGILLFGNNLIGLNLLDLFQFEAEAKNTITAEIKRLLRIQSKQSSSLSYEFKIKLNDSWIYFDTTISKLESEQNAHSVAFLHDITAHKELEELRLNELKHESAITELNTLLHEKKTTKKVFDIFLIQLSEQLNFRKAQLFWFYEADKSIQSVSAYAKNFLQLADKEDETTSDFFLKNFNQHLSNSNNKDLFFQHSIKNNNQLRGVVEYSKNERSIFTGYETKFLEKACELLIIRIEQLENEKKKDNLQKELMRINEQLEQEVNLNIGELQKLQQQHSEHEKLVLLSEINANLSHEINTPLGVVKSANQAVYEQFNSLVDIQITKYFSPLELDFIKTHSVYQPDEFNYSILSRNLEKEAFFENFKDRLAKNPEFKKIIEDIVECGFSTRQSQEIEFIMNSKSARELLMTIKELKKINSFHYMSNANINRIGSILSEIHSVTALESEAKTSVNLSAQIETLIKFLKWDLRDKQIEISLSADLHVEGNEMNLSLLWSNLLQNTIESLDQKDVYPKHILIKAEVYETELHVIIESNGLEINSEEINNVFNKFNSPKTKGKGGKLGLTICRKIAEDHNARITFTSTNEKTSFIVAFKL